MPAGVQISEHNHVASAFRIADRESFAPASYDMAVLSKPASSYIPLCTCTLGYICKCGGLKNPVPVKKRKRDGKETTEPKEASKLMKRRFVPAIAHPDILKKIMAGPKPCCNEMCLLRLYGGSKCSGSASTSLYDWDGIPTEGFGTKLFDAVIEARSVVYHTGQVSSRQEMKNILLRDVHTVKQDEQTYRFYHQGVLGDAPAVPRGIRVSQTGVSGVLDYR